MFHPTRGGTRGGAAEFRWDAVKTDKDRENYLGHSVNAPAGRWQKNKDIHWYNRENDVGVDALERAAAQRKEEIKRIKQQEEDALAAALGYAPARREDGEAGTGANAVAVPKTEKQVELERLEAEEKKARKAAKRERKEIKDMEKSMRKEIRRAEKNKHRVEGLDRHESSYMRQRSRSRTHSRSPDRRRKEESHRARQISGDRRDRDPRRHAVTAPSAPGREPYDPEAERARDRARWERNHDRERGAGADWGERHGFADR